jgi:DNA-binding winged helix-turn-helix (wHTH) protein
VTVRILADREPYSSYGDESLSSEETGPLTGSCVILNGPSCLDYPSPGLVVLPAEDFLTLAGRDAAPPRSGILYIAYGPVALMEQAFDGGCVDYIREPWALPELRARLGRFYRQKFRAGDVTLELLGKRLAGARAAVELGESECALLRLLLINAPRLLPREAAFASISSSAGEKTRALCRCVISIRRKLDHVEPGLGRRLHTIRGLGYRMDVGACG